MKKFDKDKPCTSSKDVQWTIKDIRDDSWTYILRKYKEQKDIDYEKKLFEQLRQFMIDRYPHMSEEKIEDIFAELKESEDENIKRCIGDVVRKYGAEFATGAITKEKMLAWFEKQGGQKETPCDRCRKAQPSQSCQDITELGRCYLEHEKQDGEEPMEFKSAEESLGISSEEYHKIVNDCIFGDNGENADMGIKEKAHQIAWEASKHYDPNACRQEWCEMAALDMASWLEKQGLQKTNTVEPRFKVGDWINLDFNPVRIVNITGDRYEVEFAEDGAKVFYGIKFIDKNYNLWTIEDAEDGDVLAEDSCIFIIQKLDDNNTAAKTYCTLYDDGDFDDGSILYFDLDSTHPATKEQRDILFQKMKEAGYEWDAENKELIGKKE